jgi:hypothetical protein
MEEQLLGCMEKLKEIRSLVIDQTKMIKEMQLNCQALRLASRGYEQGKPTEEGAEQCKLEDKKTMGELQNQTNLASHNFSKQQYWVEEIFANLKNLPPPCSPDYIPLPQCLDKIRCICFKNFWIMPLRTRADFKGGGMIRSYMVLVVHTRVAHYSCCVHDAENQEHGNAFVLFMLIWLLLVSVYLVFCIQL